MVAMNCWALIRRASFSSFLITRALGTSHSRLFLPFSTTSAGSLSPESSAKAPPAAGICDPKQTAWATPEISSLLDGLGFDSFEIRNGTITLTQKTKDEIIAIRLPDTTEYGSHREMYKEHWMYITIHYGDDYKKCMNFDVVAPADDHGRFLIRKVTMSAIEGDKGLHVDEFEDFLEKRGINSSNLDFMFKYAEKRKEFKKKTVLEN